MSSSTDGTPSIPGLRLPSGERRQKRRKLLEAPGDPFMRKFKDHKSSQDGVSIYTNYSNIYTSDNSL